jgi:hypothetical protein
MPKKAPPKKLPYAGWNPMIHGVTQSLVQKFIGDKDRFHKHAVLGLRETDRKEAMEYGSIFHKLIELGAIMGSKYSRLKMLTEMNKWIKRRYDNPESLMLVKIAIAVYEEYRVWEKKKPKNTYIEAEPVFAENFPLPPLTFNPNDDILIRIPKGIVIPLRGRIDGVLSRNKGIGIEENKTKSKIDVAFLQATIPSNIQVMFYAVCAELKYGKPCLDVTYNVIRKPAERQKQKETDEEFIERIKENVKLQPTHYFYRFYYEFHKGQVDKWKREELIPALYSIYLWWRSIEANPTNPWVDLNGNVNPFHGRKSFGIYDALSQGKGDFYELIVNGRKHNLTVSNELFPELSDDDEKVNI